LFVAPQEVEKLMYTVRKRQLSVGFQGNYRDWIAKVTPTDLQ